MRNNKYSTANQNGMEFISNRWVFAGDRGYVVEDDDNGLFKVYSYAHTEKRIVPRGTGLTEDVAHALAARLSGKPVNVAE